MYGAIEAGGTKFVCAVSDKDLNIVNRVEIPTTSTKETMTMVFDFFNKHPVSAMGIGSFGPIDVNRNSNTYGYITTTPKKSWRNYNFLGVMKEHFNIPYVWTTDVNVAAYGELKRGIALGKNSCIYLTVGTGIGGGGVINGQLMENFGHPEMGHLLIRRHSDDQFKGLCPYHGDCLEGMAAGPAIEARYGKKAFEIPADDRIWEIEAYYLAQASVDLTLTLAPEMIIFGGGVMKQPQLLPLIKSSFTSQMNNYVKTPDIDEYIVHCKLRDNAGITGCLLLARELLTH
ncbi:ROK family protein [Sporolactobacillus vineae]|uniref:ROK family protein n=1 Tax=Sporolactobacillus vineae TaxID=444463 RepID=UPI0002880889|nr:ROK family protein [Sporolactobacillus vineae]